MSGLSFLGFRARFGCTIECSRARLHFPLVITVLRSLDTETVAAKAFNCTLIYSADYDAGNKCVNRGRVSLISRELHNRYQSGSRLLMEGVTTMGNYPSSPLEAPNCSIPSSFWDDHHGQDGNREEYGLGSFGNRQRMVRVRTSHNYVTSTECREAFVAVFVYDDVFIFVFHHLH